MMMPAMYFLFFLFTKSLRTGIIRYIPKSISIYQRWGYSEPWNRMINPMKSAGFTVLPSMTGRRTEEQAYGEAFGGLYTPVFVDIQDFFLFCHDRTDGNITQAVTCTAYHAHDRIDTHDKGSRFQGDI